MEILVAILSIVTIISIIVMLITISSVRDLMKYLIQAVETIGAYHEANHEVSKNLISCVDRAEKILANAIEKETKTVTINKEDLETVITPVEEVKTEPKRRGRPKKKVDDLSDIGLAE